MVVKPVNLFPLFNLLPLKMYFFMVRTWSNQACSQLSFGVSYVQRHFKEKREMLRKYKVVVLWVISTHSVNPIAKDNSLWLRQEFPSGCSVRVYSPFNPFTVSVLTRSWNTMPALGLPEPALPSWSRSTWEFLHPNPWGQLLTDDWWAWGFTSDWDDSEAWDSMCPELPHEPTSPSVRRCMIPHPGLTFFSSLSHTAPFHSSSLEALPNESLLHKCSSQAPFLREPKPWGDSKHLTVLPSSIQRIDTESPTLHCSREFPNASGTCSVWSSQLPWAPSHRAGKRGSGS